MRSKQFESFYKIQILWYKNGLAVVYFDQFLGCYAPGQNIVKCGFIEMGRVSTGIECTILIYTNIKTLLWTFALTIGLISSW